jgi:superfamily I DNA/RNA helicase
VLLLARTAFATEPLQAELARAGIAHRVLGSLGLYERAEVRDALAYLTLLANPRDARAFARAVSSPRRGVGERTQSRIVGARTRPDRRERRRASARDGPLGAVAGRARAVRRRASARSRALETSDPERLEEERRLFYVACTRARDRLYLTHCYRRGGRLTGGPSRFLGEAGLIDSASATLGA